MEFIIFKNLPVEYSIYTLIVFLHALYIQYICCLINAAYNTYICTGEHLHPTYSSVHSWYIHMYCTKVSGNFNTGTTLQLHLI